MVWRFTANKITFPALGATITALASDYAGAAGGIHLQAARTAQNRAHRSQNTDNAGTRHDALEFPDVQVVLLTRLCVGQRATVLQLPAAARPEPREKQATPEVSERSLSF